MKRNGKLFLRGIHIPDRKSLSKNIPIVVPKTSDIMSISLSQHIGKPAKCIVNVGDYVHQGQLIGEADGVMSANIYSSASGTVIGIDKKPDTRGTLTENIVIENDHKYIDVKLSPLPDREPETIKNRIQEAGIVGLGGAGFPSYVKLCPKTPVDTLIINAAECEPYLTCDYRLMLEKTEEVKAGIRLLANAAGLSNIIIGIEANKPDIIDLFAKEDDFMVVVLKKAYPMGSEKHLIYCCTGRKVPLGKLPSDVGIIGFNVATAFAVYEAVELNKPLYERYMTVSGLGMEHPMNLKVKVGTRIDDIINYCGGLKQEAAMLVSGGPMMGPTLISTDYYTTKTTSALLALTLKEVSYDNPTPCINCGKCAAVCPMKLLPMKIDFHTLNGDYDLAEKAGAMDCISCGCCTYVCPAKRAIVQSVAVARSKIMEKRRGGKK